MISSRIYKQTGNYNKIIITIISQQQYVKNNKYGNKSWKSSTVKYHEHFPAYLRAQINKRVNFIKIKLLIYVFMKVN